MNNDTPIASQLRMLASYHGWANALLCKEIAAISDEHYFAPAGLFFKSIHGTLNHLLLADRAWYGRFSGKPEAFASLAQEIETDRLTLIAELKSRDGIWHTLIDNAPDDAPAHSLRYTTTSGMPAKAPWVGALTHVFNHATHHRGQITAALTQFGYACPELDLIYFVLEQPD